MLQINWHPTDRQVRNFALTSLAALPLATAIWTRGYLPAINYAVLMGGGLALLGTLWPRGLRPLLVAINVVTAPLALIVHDGVLSVAYFGLVVPVGLLFRFLGRDALQLKIDRKASTYWQPKKQPSDARSYFRRW